MKQPVSLTEVLESIRLSKSGYAFSSSIAPAYSGVVQKLVDSGALLRGRIVNTFNEMEDAFFTPQAARANAHLINFV